MNSLSRSLTYLVAIASLQFGSLLGAKEFRFLCDLDLLFDIPGCFTALTPDRLEEHFPNPEGFKSDQNIFFNWLTTDRSRAHFARKPFGNVTLELRIFEQKVRIEEAIVDFQDGTFLGATLSVYNRGDARDISQEEFDLRYKECGRQLSTRLGVRPFTKKANPSHGLLTEGYTWTSELGMAILEHNPGAQDGDIEFLRLRVMRRDARGPLGAAMRARSSASVRLSALPANVKHQEGACIISGIPMVDQGAKGYCVVASTQRLFEYYGIPCDMHQLAQIAGSDAAAGTSPIAMAEGLKKIVYRFKTRFKILCFPYSDGRLREVDHDFRPGDTFDRKAFSKEIRRYIDDGIPLLWSLQLGRVPEVPPTAPQTSGGHMRIITGYNDDTGDLYFSDSWGAGHERKRMSEDNAFLATTGLYVLHPTVR